MFNLDKINLVCKKHKINVEQCFVLYCVYTKSYKELIEYKENRKSLSISTITDLVDKNLLHRDSIINWDKIDIFDLVCTPKFYEGIFIDMQLAGEELYRTFPDFISVQGKAVMAKKGGDFNGKYHDYNALIDIYSKIIGHDIDTHKKIIRVIEKAKNKGLLNVTFRSFIVDRMWLSLYNLDDASMNEDNYKSV